MFCSHNEVDLTPHIVSIDKTDWVVIRCTACEAHIGRSYRLIDLVDKAITQQRAILDQLPPLDPDWEPPEEE